MVSRSQARLDSRTSRLVRVSSLKRVKHLKHLKHPDFVPIWTNFLVQKRNETLETPGTLETPTSKQCYTSTVTPKKYSIVSSEHNHRFFAKIEAAPKVINPKKQLQPNLVVLNSLNHESNKLNEFEILKNMLNYL